MARTPAKKKMSGAKGTAKAPAKRVRVGRKKPSAQTEARPRSAPNPVDLVSELLESPLVADTLAAGAAAALAVFLQRGLSRREEEASSKQALKRAGKAAAAAMGQKLADEFDAILKKAKEKAKSEEG